MKETRNIIVTGSSRGIGREIACKLVEEGDNVLINYLQNLEAAEQTATLVRQKGATPVIVQGNVRNPDDLKRIAKTFDLFGVNL